MLNALGLVDFNFVKGNKTRCSNSPTVLVQPTVYNNLVVIGVLLMHCQRSDFGAAKEKVNMVFSSFDLDWIRNCGV